MIDFVEVMKDHKFTDKNIQYAFEGDESVEIVICRECEELLLYKRDVIALAEYLGMELKK